MTVHARFAASCWFALSLLAVGALAQEPPPAGAAEEEEERPAAGPRAPSGVEEMVVTITKREEAVQDIPASITAFDSSQLEEANLQSISDITSLLPNVQIKGEGNEAISIRGISQSFTSSSPVAQHMNGVFHYRGGTYQNMFYDLQSVEIVRGPSGTVYGRNATAGAINLLWHEPTDEYEVFGDATVGNYSLYQFRGGANVPILEDDLLDARFAFQTVSRDSYLDNLVEGNDNDDHPQPAEDLMARLYLLSRPTEDVELKLRGYYTDSGDYYSASHPFVDQYPVGFFDFGDPSAGGLGVFPFDAYGGLQQFLNTWATPGTLTNFLSNFVARSFYGLGSPCPGANTPSCYTPQEAAVVLLTRGIPPGGPLGPSGFPAVFHPRAFVPQPQTPPSGEEEVRTVTHLAHEPSFSTLWGIDGEIEWNLGNLAGLGDVTMNLLGGYEHDRERLTSDADASTLLLLDTSSINRRYTRTAELRFSSQGWETVNWIVGFFWFERWEDFYQESLLPFGDIALCGDCPFITDRHQNDEGYAPFASISITPIEELEITLGARWNHDEVMRDSIQPPTPPRGLAAFDDTVTFREPTYEAGVKYSITEDHLVYVKGGKGYKAGGWNDDVIDTFDAQGNPIQKGVFYEPEIVWASEVGSKNTLFDGRLNLNLTGFYYKYKELQVPQIIGIQVLTVNAAEATLWGVELEAQAQPVDDWNVALTAGYLDATFDEFCADDALNFSAVHEAGCAPPGPPVYNPFGGRSDLSGNHLEDSPEWKASIFTSYDVDLGEHGRLTPVLEFTWTDDYYLRPFNLDVDRVDSYTKTDVRLIWTSADDRYHVELFGENLENEYVYARAIVGPEFTGSMPAGFGLLPPRTYGIRVGFNWYAGN